MEIEGTKFGSITIDRKTYEHDVVIRLSGEVIKRKKKLSKKYYGTSHVLSKDEAKFVFEEGCEQFIIGSGQIGNVHLSPEAEAYFAKKSCKVLLQPTPEAIRVFNKSHVTSPVEINASSGSKMRGRMEPHTLCNVDLCRGNTAYAFCAAGSSQMLRSRVSDIRNKLSTKAIAGTAIG